MRKYRVKEHNGTFVIETEVQETTGFLWWKKTVARWVKTDCEGYPRFPPVYGGYSLRPFVPHAPIKSLKEAKDRIKVWKQEPKYYYVEE